MKGGGGRRETGAYGSRERDDGLELKGRWVGPRGRSIATGLGRKPVGGCDSAEMWRPAIRSTAQDPICVACNTGWIGAMGLIYGDTSWGHMTGLGRWD